MDTLFSIKQVGTNRHEIETPFQWPDALSVILVGFKTEGIWVLHDDGKTSAFLAESHVDVDKDHCSTVIYNRIGQSIFRTGIYG